MIEEELEEREIELRPIGKSIGWILIVILLFIFYEGMAIEFRFFDEFSIAIILFFVALELTRFRKLYEGRIKEEE